MSLNNTNIPFQDDDSACSLTALSNEATAHAMRCGPSAGVMKGKCIVENEPIDFILRCQDDTYKNFMCGCMNGHAEEQVTKISKGYIIIKYNILLYFITILISIY